ncbi:PQQ-dependent sugar dehydrogenase [Arthrobacter wenxiniae]|uniref:PQQ-dependent sugar dehydrogenase n=1 Tax=Arthrobacter wenxiniae TaxID=2713570 RepID=A0A7Y7IG87_9MICC|nr:PQQ-dependent sugar dehydrogenase [Arthrobacter wenxiniae]NVM94939.1 PQQ-dependent sugar dehydrogenase [Arthrobacter wenxiniae]
MVGTGAPRRRGGPTALALCAALALASCTGPPQAENLQTTVTARPPSIPVPTGSGTVAVGGLAAPWSMVVLGDGHLLVSERDAGQVIDVAPKGTRQLVGTVAGVVHQGEGGLLGLAVHVGSCPRPGPFDPDNPCLDLFAYLTTATDNRIVRMPLLETAGRRSLGPAAVILQGIPKSSNHNGGRIAFGPDGMLYVGTGDAGTSANAQNRSSLSGKILRMTPDGGIPAGNPFPGSPVWSMGHRNVQGIAWDSRGRMWASEFGQNTWDELNEIRAGRNYGWPTVEGMGGPDLAPFTNPVLVWPTDQASPSGIAISGTTLYMAALRGERLWQVALDGEPSARALLTNQLGRLRDVALTPGGRLLVLTNNTDGRGAPTPGGDRIVEVAR